MIEEMRLKNPKLKVLKKKVLRYEEPVDMSFTQVSEMIVKDDLAILKNQII